MYKSHSISRTKFFIRLRDDDEGAAEIGVIKKSKESREYKHRYNSKISFVYLPAIGTPTYPNVEIICKNFGLEKYDIVLIITSTRFTQLDLELAKLVRSMNKRMFFIRTKIDNDMRGPSRKKNHNESKILEDIRKWLYRSVGNSIYSEKEIFLISNYHTSKWDFDRLIAAISEELLVFQREFLTNAFLNFFKKRKVSYC